jgi:hypothetical protein
VGGGRVWVSAAMLAGFLLVAGLQLAVVVVAVLLRRPDAAPGGRFLPYPEVVAATQIRRTPKAWDLRLRDGDTLSLRTAIDSDELPGGWAALDDAVAFLARTRSRDR